MLKLKSPGFSSQFGASLVHLNGQPYLGISVHKGIGGSIVEDNARWHRIIKEETWAGGDDSEEIYFVNQFTLSDFRKQKM